MENGVMVELTPDEIAAFETQWAASPPPLADDPLIAAPKEKADATHRAKRK
jgi:hypothetical protein